MAANTFLNRGKKQRKKGGAAMLATFGYKPVW